MDHDPVLERHGVTPSLSNGYVTLLETSDGHIKIRVSDGAGISLTKLTADEAAYLSSELYRLALRAKEKEKS